MRIEIEQHDVAFGRGVEFEHVANAETLLERREDIRPQPIADAQTDPMRAIVGARRRIEKIAAQFADVDEHRAVVPDRVVPEFARRKALADIARAADRKRDAAGDDAAVGMVHRQAIVHAILGARVGRGGEPNMTRSTRECVMRAAFGSPVVPEVKMKSALSSIVSAGRSCAASGAALKVSTSSSMRFSTPAASPWTKTARSAPRCCCAPAHCDLSEVSTMAALAPTMATQWASEGPVRLVLISAVATPTRAKPIQIARYSGRLGIIRQTASPLRRPRASAQWA